MSPTTSKHLARLTAVGMALGILALQQAHAQANPWYAGVQQRFEHQSNVFTTSANTVSDTISSTTVLAGLDQPIGRQRLTAAAAASTNRYQDLKYLNHQAYSVRLGLDWETAGRLSGNLAADASESLADFNPIGLTISNPGNNATRTRGLSGNVKLGVVTRLTSEVGGAARRTRFDNPAYQIRNLDIDEVYAALKYRPAGALVLGVGVRRAHGIYPNFRQPSSGGYVSESFDRNNLDLTADWPVSGASNIDARLSFGRDSYDTATARNFSGATGAVNWRWQPSGRMNVTTSFSRSSGDDTTLSNIPGQVPYSTAVNRVTNVIGTAVDYEVTGKIKARGTLSFSDGSAVDLTRNATSSEFITAASVGLVWEATRAIRAGCDISVRNRASKVGVEGYDANIFGCFGQIVLR